MPFLLPLPPPQLANTLLRSLTFTKFWRILHRIYWVLPVELNLQRASNTAFEREEQSEQRANRAYSIRFNLSNTCEAEGISPLYEQIGGMDTDPPIL